MLFQDYFTSSYNFDLLISLYVEVCGVAATAPINLKKTQSSITPSCGKEEYTKQHS